MLLWAYVFLSFTTGGHVRREQDPTSRATAVCTCLSPYKVLVYSEGAKERTAKQA